VIVLLTIDNYRDSDSAIVSPNYIHCITVISI